MGEYDSEMLHNSPPSLVVHRLNMTHPDAMQSFWVLLWAPCQYSTVLQAILCAIQGHLHSCRTAVCLEEPCINQGELQT
jgi:hypothetical protein